jgi:DNA repair protein RecO (recombination protein O)
MTWDDIGFLLSKNRYNENSLIAEIYTKSHGKITGVIFGGTSKKIKNYLQIGNKVYVNYNAKTENRIGYFKIEIHQALSPFYFDNQQKLSCISSAMNLIKVLTADSQKNVSLYKLIENFYVLLKNDNWIKDYIFWELELFSIIGFNLQFENLVDKKVTDNQYEYISKSATEKKIVPKFLIDKNNDAVDLKTLLKGLRLVGDFLEKTILKPSNISQPLSRVQFINTLK